MKIPVLLTIILTACLSRAVGQTKDSVKVGISHIFFCIDSVTYNNLFQHEFIQKIFANARETTSKTLTDSWTGKYLMGRRSYIEVFAASVDSPRRTELGDKFGDAGIVFRTKKLGDIDRINLLMKTDMKESSLKQNESDFDGKIVAFNYNLYLANADLEETFLPYVEERTMDFLKLCGFSETEVTAGITEEQFREKIRGKKFEKLYDNIDRIELTLTNKEFEYLAETLKYFGFLRTGHRFTNSALEIVCSIRQNRKYKLKAIHFTLLSNVEDVNIDVSKTLSFRASGSRASFHFHF
jgi:hypothetical protein